MKIKIQYSHRLSSGLHAYIVLPEMKADGTEKTSAQKIAEELTAAEKVQMNVNVTEALGAPAFVCATFLHLTPKKGDTAEVDVKSFMQSGRAYAVNYFADIDKEAQKAFIEGIVIEQEVNTAVAYESALEKRGSKIDVLRLLANKRAEQKHNLEMRILEEAITIEE